MLRNQIVYHISYWIRHEPKKYNDIIEEYRISTRNAADEIEVDKPNPRNLGKRDN